MGDVIHLSQQPEPEEPGELHGPGYYDIWDPFTKPVLPPHWSDHANCLGRDPAIFFPDGQVGIVESKRQVQQAKSICYACDVMIECRTFALLTNTKFGVWGGMSVNERKVMLRPRKPRWARCKKCGNVQFTAMGKARCCRYEGDDE